MDALTWLFLTVGGWIVKKLLDALHERWQRARHWQTPPTDAQVLAYHRRRFRGAAWLVAWCAVMLLLALVMAPAVREPWWYFPMALIAAIGAHSAWRLRRYAQRVREARERVVR